MVTCDRFQRAGIVRHCAPTRGSARLRHKWDQRVPITRKRSVFLGPFRFEFLDVGRKLGVWNPGKPMVDTVIRLVQQGQGTPVCPSNLRIRCCGWNH